MSNPLVYILQEGKEDLYKIGLTKNLNKDYEANSAGNHRPLEVYKVFTCDAKRFSQILDAYKNKHKGKGWYTMDESTVQKIIELLRGDDVKSEKK